MSSINNITYNEVKSIANNSAQDAILNSLQQMFEIAHPIGSIIESVRKDAPNTYIRGGGAVHGN